MYKCTKTSTQLILKLPFASQIGICSQYAKIVCVFMYIIMPLHEDLKQTTYSDKCFFCISYNDAELAALDACLAQ